MADCVGYYVELSFPDLFFIVERYGFVLLVPLGKFFSLRRPSIRRPFWTLHVGLLPIGLWMVVLFLQIFIDLFFQLHQGFCYDFDVLVKDLDNYCCLFSISCFECLHLKYPPNYSKSTIFVTRICRLLSELFGLLPL